MVDTSQPPAPASPDTGEPGQPVRLTPRLGPYAEPISRLTRAAFGAVPRSTRNVVAAAVLCGWVVVGVLIATQPPAVWLAVAVLTVAASLAPALQARWAWPWQAVILAESSRHRARLSAILGGTLTQAAGADWLARNPGAPAADRMAVLGFIGHDDLAEALIPDMPGAEPEDAFWRAWEEIGRDWRRTGLMETGRAAALARELPPDRRQAALVAVDFATAMAAVSAGRTLRSLPAPTRAPLAAGSLPIVAIVRFPLLLASAAMLLIIVAMHLVLAGPGG
jgi:hypothetical protein